MKNFRSLKQRIESRCSSGVPQIKNHVSRTGPILYCDGLMVVYGGRGLTVEQNQAHQSFELFAISKKVFFILLFELFISYPLGYSLIEIHLECTLGVSS